MRKATFYCGFGFFCLIFGGTLTTPSDHHDDRDESDDNDILVCCSFYRHDDNTQQSDFILCEHGCCGTLEVQKCCQKHDHERGLSVPFIILLSGVGFFAVVIVTITVACVYKHKQSLNKRQTSPDHIWHTGGQDKVAPQNIFYTENDDKGGKDEKISQPFTEIMNDNLGDMLPKGKERFADMHPKNNEYFVNMRPPSPPPRYFERENETETEVTSCFDGNQPPSYTVAVSMIHP